MGSPAAGQSASPAHLTLGRVGLLRVQVGYGAGPDGPTCQQFLLDLPVPETAGQDELGGPQVLAALEPVLYVGTERPRDYSLHHCRWRTSWGPSPGALEIGLLVNTETRAAALSMTSYDSVVHAFRDLLDMAGPPEPTRISREAAVPQARRSAATAYALDPDTLTLTAEEHHATQNSWTLRLRTTTGDEYDVVVGFVDGYAGSACVRPEAGIEVYDSVGSE